jgi:hypothetical protein
LNICEQFKHKINEIVSMQNSFRDIIELAIPWRLKIRACGPNKIEYPVSFT